ncbi:MAG: acetoacetate decarboxylase family protein [Spirosomataceae bacterium]
MPIHQQVLSTDGLLQPTIVAPAPWTLTGDGYIFLYRFPKQWIVEKGFLLDYQQLNYKGIVGCVMLVDYHNTPVGPYRELLLIPGLFKLCHKTTFSISKIYVSDSNSLWNGIENWGIPKELSDFTLQSIDNHTEKIGVIREGKPFFEATIQRGKISFPLTTALFPLRITQQLRDNWIITKPTAKGKAYFGKLTDIKVNGDFFPDIGFLKPVAVLAIKDFEMTFPRVVFNPIAL